MVERSIQVFHSLLWTNLKIRHCAADHSFLEGQVYLADLLFGCFDPRVVAMLAEIFMMRLEVAARALKEAVPSSTSRFIPLAPNNQFTFKPSPYRPLEAVREGPAQRNVQ